MAQESFLQVPTIHTLVSPFASLSTLPRSIASSPDRTAARVNTTGSRTIRVVAGCRPPAASRSPAPRKPSLISSASGSSSLAWRQP